MPEPAPLKPEIVQGIPVQPPDGEPPTASKSLGGAFLSRTTKPVFEPVKDDPGSDRDNEIPPQPEHTIPKPAAKPLISQTALPPASRPPIVATAVAIAVALILSLAAVMMFRAG